MVRDSEPLYLLKSPLVYVLAQVVISPVMSMSQFVPAIQENLRRKGYVRFLEEHIQEIILNPNSQMPTIAEPSVQRSVRWTFANKDNTNAIILSPNFIVLETTQYDRFETFVKELRLVLTTIGEIVEPNLAERLGLRYVDRIEPASGESFETYLQPGLLGLADTRLNVENRSAMYQFTGTTPAGQLVVRLLENSIGAPLPPDLLQSRLTFRERSQDNQVAILDIDNFTSKQFEFEPDILLEHIGELHRFADRAFRACITEDALRIWQADPVVLPAST